MNSRRFEADPIKSLIQMKDVSRSFSIHHSICRAVKQMVGSETLDERITFDRLSENYTLPVRDAEYR